MHRASGGIRRVLLHPKKEVGIGQYPFDRQLDAGLESTFLAAVLVESQQDGDFRIRDRPAIRAAAQRRNDLLGAGQLGGTRIRATYKDLAAARRVARSINAVWTTNRNTRDRRVA